MTHHMTHLVAGGTKGIGRALVESLILNEHDVHSIGREIPADRNSEVNWILADLEKPYGFKDALPESIDCLTFCPGVIKLGNIKRLTEQDLQETFQRNVVDAFKLTQELLPLLKNEKPASIVYLSSVAAQVGLPNHCAIAAAKAGLEGFALSLAADLAPRVRVNVVAPTLTTTENGLKIVGGSQFIEMLENRHALKKIPSPEEVAATIAFLHSIEASSITGQVITVDAGMARIKHHEK